jgi:hypothetical protein
VIDRSRLARLRADEEASFLDLHPRSAALFCPAHTEADVDRHTEVFAGALAALT